MDSEKCDLYTSPEFPVQKTDDVQTFTLKPICLVWETDLQQNSYKDSPKKTKSVQLDHDDLVDALATCMRGDGFNEQQLIAIIMEKLRKKRKREREKLLEGTWYVRINLIGKTQTQPTDNLYYTCIDVLDLKGDVFELK